MRVLLELGADAEMIRKEVLRVLAGAGARPRVDWEMATQPARSARTQRSVTASRSSERLLLIGWLLFGTAAGIGLLVGWLIWG